MKQLLQALRHRLTPASRPAPAPLPVRELSPEERRRVSGGADSGQTDLPKTRW
jgi:hypothetical protein